ncbi:MAG: stage III sporulation protein AE, partial [Lachnospiraceae bacterium]|nr:stage III sporulation protein AE [Lachnospiraceae bacterium]
MDMTVDFTQSLGLEELSERIGGVFGGSDLSFFDLILNALKGEHGFSVKWMFARGRQAGGAGGAGFKMIFASILIIGIFSAVFAQFGQLFESRQVADISYDIAFLLMVMVLLKIMQKGMDIAQESLLTIADFSKLLVPTYCLSVGFAAGSTTAIAFYELALIVIYLIENLLLVAVIPMIYAYTLLSVMSGISSDGRLDGILAFTKKGISFV